jgi:phosphoglucosamine mutase
VLVDERGEVMDGDAVLALCARDLAERGKLKGGAVVATIMSNLGRERALERQKIRLVRTKVGDRYVVEEMRSGGYNLGGEQSGHVVFLDHNTTGDGLLTGLQALAILRRKNKPLSELVGDVERFPQVLVNVRVAEKRPIEGMPVICDAIKKVEAELAGKGRVLIRYSGTEPKIRVMVEGEDEERVQGYARDLADLLKRALGGAA